MPLLMKKAFKIWKYALGSFSDDKTERYDDYVVLVRTIIFISYLVTNCFIISGVIRHWNPMSEQFTEESLMKAYTDLGWDMRNDDIVVEVAGASVYMIDGAGTKWAPLKGTVKYNKDAFIVIKNRSRDPVVPSTKPE